MSSHHVPIIWLGGQAGSGKDTVGSYIAKCYGGVCVAQADPMKRFASKVFGFSDEQLWGPSASRNAVDERTVTDKLAISKAFGHAGDDRNNEILTVIVPAGSPRAHRRLELWFEKLYHSLENGIPLSPRLVLQTLGTEFGRTVSKDMWSRYAIETCRQLLCGGFSYTPAGGLVDDETNQGYDFATITDGRFRNEATNVRMRGGVALRIVRDTDTQVVDASGVKGHVSERELGGIPLHFFNDLIRNDGTIEQLTERVDSFIRYNYGV